MDSGAVPLRGLSGMTWCFRESKQSRAFKPHRPAHAARAARSRHQGLSETLFSSSHCIGVDLKPSTFLLTPFTCAAE